MPPTTLSLFPKQFRVLKALLRSSFRTVRTQHITASLKKLTICTLISCLLTASTVAAPETIKGIALSTWQDMRFAILSGSYSIGAPTWLATFLHAKSSRDRVPSISRIQIYPGPLNLYKGQETVLSAIAFDEKDQLLSGVEFDWTVTETEKARTRKRLINATFKANKVGNFTIKASARGVEAEVPVVVTPFSNTRPSDTPVYRVSSRTGGRILQTTDQTGDSEKADEITQSSRGEQAKQVSTSQQLLPGEGWDDTNWPSGDDPGNQTGNSPGGAEDGGAGSGNFQLSAPVVSVPGRGIDLALSLNYNSRVWNKSNNNLAFDISYDEPAAGWNLGFGRMMSMGTQGGCMIADADGTRHGYTGSVTSWNGGMEFSGHTTDGSLIDYGCSFYWGNFGYGWSKLPNGTTITYSSITSVEAHLHPTTIADAQGNYISITYRNANGNALIETVTDTMGRVTTFQYDSLDRLISVTVPRMEGGAGGEEATELP